MPGARAEEGASVTYLRRDAERVLYIAMLAALVATSVFITIQLHHTQRALFALRAETKTSCQRIAANRYESHVRYLATTHIGATLAYFLDSAADLRDRTSVLQTTSNPLQAQLSARAAVDWRDRADTVRYQLGRIRDLPLINCPKEAKK
jgi:type II secretory pathway component PulL